MTEVEKYQGIYANPDKYAGYGHCNHGGGALPILLDWKPLSVLDVGCGHNEFCQRVKTRLPGTRAVGVDFACPGADMIASATALPFANHEFDVVTAFDVLEHLLPDEVDTSLGEMSRVAKKFIFSICYRASVILWEGHNLHPTVRPEQWWIDCIGKRGGVNIRKVKQYLAGEFL